MQKNQLTIAKRQLQSVYALTRKSNNCGKEPADIAQCPVFSPNKRIQQKRWKIEKKSATELSIERSTLLDFINLSYSKCHGTYSKCLAFSHDVCQGLSEFTVTIIYIFLRNREKIPFPTFHKFALQWHLYMHLTVFYLCATTSSFNRFCMCILEKHINSGVKIWRINVSNGSDSCSHMTISIVA